MHKSMDTPSPSEGLSSPPGPPLLGPALLRRFSLASVLSLLTRKRASRVHDSGELELEYSNGSSDRNRSLGASQPISNGFLC